MNLQLNINNFLALCIFVISLGDAGRFKRLSILKSDAKAVNHDAFKPWNIKKKVKVCLYLYFQQSWECVWTKEKMEQRV